MGNQGKEVRDRGLAMGKNNSRDQEKNKGPVFEKLNVFDWLTFAVPSGYGYGTRRLESSKPGQDNGPGCGHING